MPQRHATVSELIELIAELSHVGYLAGKRAMGTTSRLSESGEEVIKPFAELSESSKDINRAVAASILDGLGRRGVPIDQLVTLTVDEPVNLCETADDAARRFAGYVLYAEQLFAEGRSIMDEMNRATSEPLATGLLDRVRTWTQKVEAFPQRTDGEQ